MIVLQIVRLVVATLLQLQQQTLMKKIENVNDQIDIDIQNLYMRIVIDEKLLYDENVMLDIIQNQKIIKLGWIHHGIVLQIVKTLVVYDIVIYHVLPKKLLFQHMLINIANLQLIIIMLK